MSAQLSTEVADHIRHKVLEALPEGTHFAIFIKAEQGAHMISHGISYANLIMLCRAFVEDEQSPPKPLPPE